MPVNEIKAFQDTTAQILSHPTWDLILLFVLLAAGFFYGLSAGRRKIVSSIIYTYVAYALVPAMPYERLIKIFDVKSPSLLKIIFFVVVFALLLFFLGRGGGRSFASSASWWQIFLLSFAQAGLTIHIILSFLPPERIGQLAPLTRTLFANPDLHLWWLALPLLLLFVLRRFETRE